jgi:hypothetical protein
LTLAFLSGCSYVRFEDPEAKRALTYIRVGQDVKNIAAQIGDAQVFAGEVTAIGKFPDLPTVNPNKVYTLE